MHGSAIRMIHIISDLIQNHLHQAFSRLDTRPCDMRCDDQSAAIRDL